METRPADSESGYVFHHANTSLFRLGNNERRGGLSSAAVGKRTDMYPEDAGKLIRPGDQIHFSMHLFPIGREVVDAMHPGGRLALPRGRRAKVRHERRDFTQFG